jgi:hypothetical protein
MPIKGPPKQIIGTEMHKFKEGDLHSGSKQGPKVKNRKQAIAIALSEARKGKPTGMGGADPMERSVAAADVSLSHAAHGERHEDDFNMGLNGTHPGTPAKAAPPKLGPAPAPLPAPRSHGYGHSAPQRVGHLRMSGHQGAHRIGRR